MSKLSKQEQQQLYREFMAIKTEEEALSFIKAILPNPAGKPYFTPMDYRWHTMKKRQDVILAHHRSWGIVRGFFPSSERRESDAKVEAIESLIVSVMVEKTDALRDWIVSRYADIGDTYLLPDEFLSTRQESPEDWAKDTNLEFIEVNGETMNDIRYYWQEVKPASEPKNDGRRHCILVDRITHQEAPLASGQEPFPR